MDPKEFSESQHQFVQAIGEGLYAYVPPLAPRTVPLSSALVRHLADASLALGNLEGTGRHLPNPRLLIGPYLRREAVLSSRIEGTHTGFSELVLFEAEESSTPTPDVREVWNYVAALEAGVLRLKELPVSLRLVRELHARLMLDVRGGGRDPGQFRRAQNFVGQSKAIEQAVYVPPPPGPALDRTLDDWERFLHREDDIPLLIRCAWMHYQFETIHPFLDGNGRTGRLLIPLLLLERGILSQPLLYVSAFLERNRDAYYQSLMAGRLRGDLEPWFSLFLEAVATQANDATTRADTLNRLRLDYHARFAKSRSAVIRPLIDELFARTAITVPAMQKLLGASDVAVQAAVNALVQEGVLFPSSGRKWRRVYLAGEILSAIMPEEAK